MPYTVIYNSEERIIQIKVQGDFSINVAKAMITEAAQVAKAQNCFLILNDMREARLNLSMLEIYQMPKTITDIFTALELDVHKFKRALVATNGLKAYSFFETVTLNRSQPVKYFLDLDEAKKWLSGK